MKFKTLIFSTLLLLSFQLFGQKETLKPFFYTGPSITNIHQLIYGERTFSLFPEKPFYEINYHVGVGAELELNNHLNLRGSINYERKGAAEVGFNKTNQTYGDFIQMPISLMVRPLKEKEVKFEFGLSTNYLINTKNTGGITARSFRTLEIAAIIGIEFNVFKNIYFGTRLVEPFNDLSGNVVSLSGTKSPSSEKSQSFQFSIIYKID